jgi:hypothetical protein
MTTIAESPLTEALQALVDARLDTIDRMLIGRVNRADRLAIVREVESQVFDLLQRHEGDTLDRDDVLAVLARLDPPEAYLPDEDSSVPSRPTRIAATPRAVSAPAQAGTGRLGLAGGILGLVSLAPILLMATLESGVVSVVFAFYGSITLCFIACVLAIIFAARVRLRGPWAIVGLVTGILSLLAIMAYGILILANS